VLKVNFDCPCCHEGLFFVAKELTCGRSEQTVVCLHCGYATTLAHRDSRKSRPLTDTKDSYFVEY
jgi:transcription elongation factor Elf1